jgi:hypothetical protein
MLNSGCVIKAGPSRKKGPDSQRHKLIEEFASLDREIENYLPRIQRHQKLRQLILDWHKDALPEEEITVAGATCDILISSRDKIRTVTPEGKRKLFRLWGPKAFIARSQVLLKALPDPKDEDGLYTEQALTGPRHLHVMARANAAQPAA